MLALNQHHRVNFNFKKTWRTLRLCHTKKIKKNNNKKSKNKIKMASNTNSQKLMMDERLSSYEIEFSARFSSAIKQMAEECLALTLPIVVIEHIYNLDNNLSVVRSQARRGAKEGMPLKNEEDEYEHKLRISVYVFDKEGSMYPNKTASKTPLNVALFGGMFKMNTSITRPKYVQVCQQAKPKRNRKSTSDRENQRIGVSKKNKNRRIVIATLPVVHRTK